MKIIFNIVIKEFLQLKRDPRLFVIVFLAPVLQLIFLGYAANLDLNKIHTVIYDLDKTAESRNLIRKLESSGYFSIDYYVHNYEKVTNLIDNGDALMALVIPNDFEKKINRKETVSLQAIFDGSDGNKASIAFGYVQGIVSNYSKNILIENMNKAGIMGIHPSGKNSLSGSIIPEIRIWYNPNLKTRNFMVPSIMGLILMVITTILMAMGIVKEREIGTLEQLIVTPIKPFQLILGKLIPFVILGFIDVLLVTSIMVFWFGIPIRGDFFFLMIASFLFVLSTVGLGLFVSTISKTQQQAMMIAMFGILMPMIYLSGFVFPIESMPKIIQYLTYIIPLKYFIIILRDVILKGTGFSELYDETVVLLIMGIVILLLSSLRFKKRLE